MRVKFKIVGNGFVEEITCHLKDHEEFRRIIDAYKECLIGHDDPDCAITFIGEAGTLTAPREVIRRSLFSVEIVSRN